VSERISTKAFYEEFVLLGRQPVRETLTEKWPIPTGLELDRTGQFLRYRILQPARHAAPTRDLLDDFTELVDLEGRDVLAFAKRWGVLGLCAEHNRPASHPLEGSAHLFGGGCALNEIGDPLEAWFTLARQFRAVRLIAARLRDNEKGRTEDWRALGYPRTPKRIRQHDVIEQTIQGWLLEGDVRPQFLWDGPQPRFELVARSTYSGLFGALATQLAITIAGATSDAICDACGQPYVPKRKPQAGRHHYCDREHCRYAAQRFSQRRRRARLENAT
jgi:hypothetical protein